MISREMVLRSLSCLFVCLIGSRLRAANAPEAGAPDQAIIYYSFAPWDGAAYDIEIPLEGASDGAKPVIRINIWGYPQFPEPKTIRFSGKEDPGGGPLKGDGIAHFQAVPNKSMPERLVGSVSFKVLKNDLPVSGTYEFETLNGKRRFKGNFQASWGNKPARVIR